MGVATIAMTAPVLLVNGVLLGLGAAAPIGPVNVEIARRTLRSGRAAGFALGFGAVTVDVAYAMVTSLTFLPVLRYPKVTAGMSVLAAIFLAYLGVLCLKSAWGGHGSVELETEGRRERASGGWSHYRTGLLMTALNPMTLIFWFVAVPGAAGAGAAGGGLWAVAAGVFFGAFAWVCFFTWTVGHLRRFGGQRWLAWVDFAGGLTLLAFAGRAIWRLITSPL
jgi:L-lysine exporter family protein LysE/ArgO